MIQDFGIFASLIWKPIPVFIELRHIIDSHSEIYAKNNSYKPKINILSYRDSKTKNKLAMQSVDAESP